jgi:hypothetical protein
LIPSFIKTCFRSVDSLSLRSFFEVQVGFMLAFYLLPNSRQLSGRCAELCRRSTRDLKKECSSSSLRPLVESFLHVIGCRYTRYSSIHIRYTSEGFINEAQEVVCGPERLAGMSVETLGAVRRIWQYCPSDSPSLSSWYGRKIQLLS